MQPLNTKLEWCVRQRYLYPGTAYHGSVWRVPTDVGNLVNVWVPEDNVPLNHRYFCHGHALGTYYQYGYTVFSNDDLSTVLRDEYFLVGSLHHLHAGDIVVWRGIHGFDHSAIVNSIHAMDANGVVPSQTFLSSKNGSHPLNNHISLASLINTYGDKYALFRHR
jgi:hypothetical protein